MVKVFAWGGVMLSWVQKSWVLVGRVVSVPFCVGVEVARKV